jgi:lysophospholipase L1-like esterase
MYSFLHSHTYHYPIRFVNIFLWKKLHDDFGSLKKSRIVPSIFVILIMLQVVVVVSVLVGVCSALIEVACVGDSITKGIGGSVSYPTLLQQALGTDYLVKNYGVPGATIMKDGDISFWNSSEYTALMSSKPDVVVMMFGTNDARSVNWNTHQVEFQANYNQFILALNTLSSRPQLHLCTPPPIYKDGSMGVIQAVVNQQLPTLINTISKDNDLNQVINVFKALGGVDLLHPEYIGGDGIHPNDAGYKVLAETAYSIVKQDYDTSVAHGKL